MDYDDMKQAYSPNNSVSLSFGITFDCPEIFQIKNVNKLIEDIHHELGDNGCVECSRIENKTQIVVRNVQIYDFIKMIKAIDRDVIKMKVPLLLYQKKDVLERLVDEICYDKCMAKLMVDEDVVICIAGRLQDVRNARKRVLFCVERLMNKEPIFYKGYVSSELLLKNKVRIFYVSKINESEVVLSGRNNLSYEIMTSLKPKQQILEQTVHFDSVKLTYAFFYLRSEIDDILVEHDCYINYSPESTITKLCVKSFQMANLKKCLRSLRCLFRDIIKMSFNEELSHCSYNVFTFESSLSSKGKTRKKYLTVGLRSEMKMIIEDSSSKYEIEIDIDNDLEDFICGKKNGKINKICKDNECSVVLYSKLVNGEKKTVSYISGVGTNLYKTVVSLEDEYPAELTFHLHDKHHRRIIGYAGKNIQKVMKRHGVYIKFMSEEERVLLGYDENVIIKTPRRNVSSLKKMQEEVMVMAEEECIQKIEVRRELDLYTYYEYFFEDALMWLNRIFIMKLLPPKNIIYLLNKLAETDILSKDLVKAVRIVDCPEIYLYSFEKLNLEVITCERWVDRRPNLPFKLFDSVLLYAYEPTFQLEFEKSKREIDFSDKVKKYTNDVYAVGNRKKERDRHAK